MKFKFNCFGHSLKLFATKMKNNEESCHHKSLHKSDSHKMENCSSYLPFQHRPSSIADDKFHSETKQRHDQLTEDFLTLSSELEADGLMDPDPWSYMIGLGNTIALFSIGLYITYCYTETSPIWGFLGVILITLSEGPSLLFGQEGLIMGLSTSTWTAKHMEFHAMLIYGTDKERQQNDLWFHLDRFWFLFWEALIVTLSWKLYHHLEFVIMNECWFELICIIAHYSLIPVLGFSVWFAITWLSSIFVVLNLILSHVQKPIRRRQTSKLHWIEYIFCRVTNIRPFYFVSWWTVHLNYQIEHHLFPAMPYHNLRLCSDKVRRFAEKHNLPYQQCSFLEACKLVYYNPAKEIIMM